MLCNYKCDCTVHCGKSLRVLPLHPKARQRTLGKPLKELNMGFLQFRCQTEPKNI